MRRARHVVQPERDFLCARNGPRGDIWVIWRRKWNREINGSIVMSGGDELEANVKVAD
jgi:hypothetical protein